MLYGLTTVIAALFTRLRCFFILVLFLSTGLMTESFASPGSEYELRRQLTLAATVMQSDPELSKEIFTKLAADGNAQAIQMLKFLDELDVKKALVVKEKELAEAAKVAEAARKRISYKVTQPHMLAQSYIVSSSGRVTQLGGHDNDLGEYIKLASNMDKERGIPLHSYAGNAKYNLLSGVFSYRSRIFIPPDKKAGFRNCLEDGKVFTGWSEYAVKSKSLDDGKYLSDTWILTNKSPLGVCVYHNISMLTCQVTGCIKYEKRPPMMLTKNKQDAFDLGAENLKIKRKSFSEFSKEMESYYEASNVNEKRTDEKQPGYYDANGGCGFTSCNQKAVDDYVIDQFYW